MKKLIIANWKMNPVSAKKAEKDLKIIEKGIKKTEHEVIICTPFIYLNIKTSLRLGAQDCFWEDRGPYTGEISPLMLKDLGIKYVIVGHSERKALGETEEKIKRKLRAALKLGLTPILCIGEKKGESAKKIINTQLRKDLKGTSKKHLKKIIIAYEPVWAIGTGDFCKPEKAKKALNFIKNKINNRILYGGSVNSKIAKSYIKVGFDGLLVGGASLNAREFVKIVKNA